MFVLIKKRSYCGKCILMIKLKEICVEIKRIMYWIFFVWMNINLIKLRLGYVLFCYFYFL